MRRRGLCRPRYLTPGDSRSPMRRLLEDALNQRTGNVEVQYDQQWRTFFKAQRRGYIAGGGDNVRVTEAGEAFLRSKAK